jgi:hypothetical protein
MPYIYLQQLESGATRRFLGSDPSANAPENSSLGLRFLQTTCN